MILFKQKKNLFTIENIYESKRTNIPPEKKEKKKMMRKKLLQFM